MPHAARAALAFTVALLCAATCRRFPTGRIEGTVRDRSGTPIANVHVGVVGLAHIGPSDTSGRYRLTSVPVGTHRLRATSVAYASQERDSVVVRQSVTTRVDFTLDRMWTSFRRPLPQVRTGRKLVRRGGAPRVGYAGLLLASRGDRLPRPD
jgi:hypothetical protein